MLASADPHHVKGANFTVRQLLSEFEFELVGRLGGEPLVEASIREWVGGIYHDLGLADKAEPHLRRAGELRAGLATK